MTDQQPVSKDQTPAPGLPDLLLHIMLRVGDMDRSIRFYTGFLGMQLLYRHDFPGGRFTLAFLGYGDEESHSVLELTHNWDTNDYEPGTAYGHIALSSSDIYGLCAWLEQNDVKVVRPPGPMRGGPELAFIEDPDGYKIELIQDGTIPAGD